MTRDDLEALDRDDPLAPFLDRFVVDDPSLVYLDGNSLGRLSHDVADAVADAMRTWASELVVGWERWVDIATEVGDEIGTQLLGAHAGETLAGESTTVNLFKLLSAARADRPGPIVCDQREFPTDRYVAGAVGDVVPSIVDGASVVVRSVVDYRTGAIADMTRVTAVAHDAGALMLWDCSHAVGAVALDLRTVGADLAVGCTYKHLSAGPGSPAWLWVRAEHQDRLRQPIAGWWGQTDRFSMDEPWNPLPGIAGWASGTPNVLGLTAVRAAVALVADAGIDRVRAKSMRLTSAALDVANELELDWASPLEPEHCGAHVAIRHEHAAPVVIALRERGVIPDLRPPDIIRIGLSPLTTRFVDVWDGLGAVRGVLDDGSWRAHVGETHRVT